jgi:hypothetical protein
VFGPGLPASGNGAMMKPGNASMDLFTVGQVPRPLTAMSEAYGFREPDNKEYAHEFPSPPRPRVVPPAAVLPSLTLWAQADAPQRDVQSAAA